ncbi:hypothetical protein N7520_009855 [Penicillium odoratum]|uniref:uncharacterized protein n=1 Tax=Penicillium odoratum TaxID=1167516 RepID=UPI0025474A6F|nr:uncharacterized protein N7520_009855 [Penicillium odoratum]KAJ5752938.1 hypothetical protein N7520_009855 [Penicillium odoratum]
MSIIDCPPELLHMIGSDLHQKDTRNLISTSHRMHSVQTFLYTVARNPELAGYVQSLALAGWETYQDWETNREPEKTIGRPNFDGDLIRQLVDEATEYPEEEKSKWLQDLEGFFDDAWLALLIPRLTGLRKIGLKWPFRSPHVSLMLKDAAINGGACFPHVEEVNICWYDTENAIASYRVHPFFFPSVRKILKDVSLPPRCSNVTDIDLSETNAAEGMREWIRACKTLKSFRIMHHAPYAGFQPHKLYNSLSLHKSNLEAIWVGHDEYGLDGDNDDDWMGSFVDFSALKILRLRLINLVGLNEQGSLARKISDVIPLSLETLFLDMYWQDFRDFLDDLAEIAISRRFSKIATVHIETYSKCILPQLNPKVEWLQQRFREVGVACHVHTRIRESMEDIGFGTAFGPSARQNTSTILARDFLHALKDTQGGRSQKILFLPGPNLEGVNVSRQSFSAGKFPAVSFIRSQ